MRRILPPWVAAAAAFLTACAGAPAPSRPAASAPRPGGVFRFLLTQPGGLDPASYEDAYQWQLMDQIFDGLVDFDTDLNVTPALARTWTVSPDGLTYTFELREDARFHNGRQVVAEDVAWSYLRAGRVKTGVAREYMGHIVGAEAAFTGKAASIEGIRVTGPHTLTIRLAHPYAPFLPTLAIPPLRVVPREAVEGHEAEFQKVPVGSGAFRVVEWRADNVLVLAANDAYFLGRPYLDRIEVRLGDWRDEVGPFVRGEVDRALLGREDRKRLPIGTPVMQRLELGMTCLGLNLATPPFGDERVRRAAALSLDRAAMVEVSERVAVASRGIVPDGIPGGGPHAFAPERDLEQARRALAEAGHPEGKGLPAVDFWANHGNPVMKAVSAVIARNLGEIGIRVRERSAPWAEFLRVVDGKTAPLYMLTWVADTPDRDSYLGILFHSQGANNYIHYADPAVDRLLKQAREEMDPVARGRLYNAAEEKIGAANVLIPLFSQANAFAFRPGMRGFTLDAFGNTDLRRLWWSEAR